MAASLPRPMRTGAWSRSARSPAFAPSVTRTWVGEPRRRDGAFAGLAAFWPREAAPRAASGTRAPNMSERMTEIAESTKIHRIARKATRIRNRVSSDIHGLLDDPDRHRGAADPHLRAVAHAGVADPVPVDEHPVGGAEVADLERGPVGRALDHELDVPPAHAGVVDPDVGVGA